MYLRVLTNGERKYWYNYIIKIPYEYNKTRALKNSHKITTTNPLEKHQKGKWNCYIMQTSLEFGGCIMITTPGYL